jgi:SAM-dependent methyltransferase
MEVPDLAADSFIRYLNAKKSVDDRSLNLGVYQKLTAALAAGNQAAPLKIVEIGCGIGTLIERLWDWGLVSKAAFTAIDRDQGLIVEARVRLKAFARCRHLAFSEAGEALRMAGGGRDWLITLKAIDFLDFCQGQAGKSGWDLLLAHAFLDLVDLDMGLPRLFSLLRPGGWYYFTLNFDGETILHPPVDPEFEDQVVKLYHQSMDERQKGSGGHSQTGRRLLGVLYQNGREVMAAGSSDWVVWPTPESSYPADEKYFLHYVLETINRAVVSHPDLDKGKFQFWLTRRRAQIEAGELIFLAHQLDLCGRL